jgi:isopentenyl-diphosphate delta-isomerase
LGDSVILVDDNDNEIGLMPKMEAHIQGKLHRAFSIFVFNQKGELLLQRRALTKYHSGGKWTNTCCSHPRANENTCAAARRRLVEEMGLDCELTYGFHFLYKAEVNDGLHEHEYDHVYFGVTDDLPKIADEEVLAYEYINMDVLANELKLNPNAYTAWLKICFDQVLEFYRAHFRDGNIHPVNRF